jgi:hypothetical protein
MMTPYGGGPEHCTLYNFLNFQSRVQCADVNEVSIPTTRYTQTLMVQESRVPYEGD